jgi:hypothetical protein
MKARPTSETTRDMGIKETAASKYSRMLTKVPNPWNRENYSKTEGMDKSGNTELEMDHEPWPTRWPPWEGRGGAAS